MGTWVHTPVDPIHHTHHHQPDVPCRLSNLSSFRAATGTHAPILNAVRIVLVISLVPRRTTARSVPSNSEHGNSRVVRQWTCATRHSIARRQQQRHPQRQCRCHRNCGRSEAPSQQWKPIYCPVRRRGTGQCATSDWRQRPSTPVQWLPSK